jgi:hypothetical protein
VGGGAAGAGLQQGFALSSAGGLSAAAEAGKASTATAAADAARTSFGLGPRETLVAPIGATSRRPLATSTASRALPATPAPAAPLPPKADPRATSFGRGVPLRDRVPVPGAQADGYVVIGAAPPVDPSGLSRRGRAAPWERLAPSVSRDAGDREQHARRPSCGCHRCDPLGRGGRR